MLCIARGSPVGSLTCSQVLTTLSADYMPCTTNGYPAGMLLWVYCGAFMRPKSGNADTAGWHGITALLALHTSAATWASSLNSRELIRENVLSLIRCTVHLHV